MSKQFPIKVQPACQLKWNWSTIRLYDGTTSSCHRVNPDSLTADNLHTFHNTPNKLADRRAMLSGQWPGRGCEYCRDIEAAGGSSDRMFHLSIPDMAPPELDDDPTAIEVTPRIVEVYFDNVCNMACLYCWDGFSSKIQQENNKFGRFEQQGVIIDNHARKVPDMQALTDKFWSWMSENHRTIRRFHVLGGEPFYQRQFDQCLEFLDQHPSPDLEFNVISNLKVSQSKLISILDKIDDLQAQGKIKRFDLTASIDCFGKEQEYVRFGINVEQWKENFALVAQRKSITLNINQTLSTLTIKTVPELVRFINSFRHQREIGHYFSTTVMTHEFLHPGIFGQGFYSSDFDAIIAEMPEDTWQQKQARKYMEGIRLQIDSMTRDPGKIKQLAIFLDEIDRRRGLDWKLTFPWLERELHNVV